MLSLALLILLIPLFGKFNALAPEGARQLDEEDVMKMRLLLRCRSCSRLRCRRSPQGFTPTRPIEVVVHTGPGGGSDVLARAMALMMEKEKLLPVRMQVVNKPGGGGVVAPAYLAEKKGDTAHHRHLHRRLAHQPADQRGGQGHAEGPDARSRAWCSSRR